MRWSTGLGIALAIGLVWVTLDGARRLANRAPPEPVAAAPVAAVAPRPVRVDAVPAPHGDTVVFPGESAADMVAQFSRWPPPIEGGWDVSAEAIAQLDEDFPKISRVTSNRCCAEGASIPEPDTFHRQVVGVVMRDGRRMLYINAVGKQAPPAAWRNEPVRASEGSGAYWGVLYDPQARVFSDLAINAQ